MVDMISFRIARAIKRIEPEKTASIDVLKFSLEILINTLFTISTVAIIGILSGEFSATMLGLGAFIVLRYFSGGLHMQKAIHCSMISILAISIAPHVPLTIEWTRIFGIASLVLVLVFAPSNIEGHARIPKKFFPFLKIISAILVALNFLPLNSTVACVFLLQSITTIRIQRR